MIDRSNELFLAVGVELGREILVDVLGGEGSQLLNEKFGNHCRNLGFVVSVLPLLWLFDQGGDEVHDNSGGIQLVNRCVEAFLEALVVETDDLDGVVVFNAHALIERGKVGAEGLRDIVQCVEQRREEVIVQILHLRLERHQEFAHLNIELDPQLLGKVSVYGGSVLSCFSAAAQTAVLEFSEGGAKLLLPELEVSDCLRLVALVLREIALDNGGHIAVVFIEVFQHQSGIDGTLCGVGGIFRQRVFQ